MGKRVHLARPSTLDKQNTHSSNAAVAIAFAIGTDGGKGIVWYGENYGGVCFGVLYCGRKLSTACNVVVVGVFLTKRVVLFLGNYVGARETCLQRH